MVSPNPFRSLQPPTRRPLRWWLLWGASEYHGLWSHTSFDATFEGGIAWELCGPLFGVLAKRHVFFYIEQIIENNRGKKHKSNSQLQTTHVFVLTEVYYIPYIPVLLVIRDGENVNRVPVAWKFLSKDDPGEGQINLSLQSPRFWKSRTFLFWVVVSNIFNFHPYLGKWSNLTNIFRWVETTNQFCLAPQKVVKICESAVKTGVAYPWCSSSPSRPY